MQWLSTATGISSSSYEKKQQQQHQNESACIIAVMLMIHTHNSIQCLNLYPRTEDEENDYIKTFPHMHNAHFNALKINMTYEVDISFVFFQIKHT